MDFNWDNMANNLQNNAFGEKKSYANDVDTRFWKLSRDENDNGAAIIRFLPDSNNVPFVNLTKINANKGDKKSFFVNEPSPTTIGLKCPFNEKFSELWKNGEKETAKTLGRTQRYITNIKVIKDPANPSNEGKIFLYDMSQTMIDMLKGVMIQTESMKALDESPVEVFNPLQGSNFLLKVKMGATKILTYGDSKFSDKVTSIYESKEDAEKDIKENTYPLKEFLDPTNFKTYDELKVLLDKFLGVSNAEENNTPEPGVSVKSEITEELKPVPKVETKSSSIDDELDDLLAGME